MLSYIVAFTALIAFTVSASPNLQGSHIITPQDYYGLPTAALANSPPACGMPYNQLNLARITAVQKMNTKSTCNLCLKIVNSANPAKLIYALAVDLGGNGLDLSIPAFEYLFDQGTDPSPASWSTVDYSFCTGIYTPGKVNPNQGVHAGSLKPVTTTKKVTKKKSTTKKSTSKNPTIKKSTSKKPTIKKSTSKKSTTKKSTFKKPTNKKSTTKKTTTKKTSTKPKNISKKKTTTQRNRRTRNKIAQIY